MAIRFDSDNREIYIVDTTLRDGEQTAGVVFANEEKVVIADMLSDLGVDQLEVGIPTMGGDEKKAIKQIVKRNNNRKSIMAWNRAVISDIEESIDCGVDAVAISVSVSDIHIKHKLRTSREWVLENMIKSVEFAKKNGLYVSVNGEDASRADKEFLVRFIEEAKKAGADRFRYCDTVGIREPFSLRADIEELYKKTNFNIEMHTHNDFGMATANAIAGILGGASHVGVTVNGLGERAGNAALEEVLMALEYVYGYKAVLKPGETTVPLFQEIAMVPYLEGELDTSKSYDVSVVASVIQKQDDGKAMKEVYQEYIKQYENDQREGIG